VFAIDLPGFGASRLGQRRISMKILSDIVLAPSRLRRRFGCTYGHLEGAVAGALSARNYADPKSRRHLFSAAGLWAVSWPFLKACTVSKRLVKSTSR
jgi:hypothetical protein